MGKGKRDGCEPRGFKPTANGFTPSSPFLVGRARQHNRDNRYAHTALKLSREEIAACERGSVSACHIEAITHIVKTPGRTEVRNGYKPMHESELLAVASEVIARQTGKRKRVGNKETYEKYLAKKARKQTVEEDW